MRRYGNARPDSVVLHGGPGGAGEVADLAQALARRGVSVLEPFQTGHSIDAQVIELAEAISENCKVPASVIGWSWGAWLALLFANRYPELVKNLVLIGSGPFRGTENDTTSQSRLVRLSDQEKAEYASVKRDLQAPGNLERMLDFLERIDSYAPIKAPRPTVTFDPDIHRNVWAEAVTLRKSGGLIEALKSLRCPVTAIHGDHDPHPAEGVRSPLLEYQPRAKFVLLAKCGHKPWREIYARDAFFTAMNTALVS